MPHLLLELHSEEIPARMQARAEADLRKAVLERLTAAGLAPEAVRTFSGPRRFGLAAEGVPVRQKDQTEEKKGPRVGAPDQAVQGFLKSAGLQSLAEAIVVEDKKGDYYLSRVERPGQDASALLPELVAEILKTFPWPKSMRSGAADFTWVRPLRNVLMTFDGEAIPVAIPGVPSQGLTYGHRFHAPAAFPVRRFEDYEQNLRKAFVIIDRDERKQTILSEARTVCAAQNLELVEDPGLLEEVSGLSEWPVVLMGQMDPAFLDLPAEVIRLTMRTHQKYFAVRDPKAGGLAARFVTVANIEAKDGGRAIAAGNARVLSARLNDAQFFWAKDLETPLFTEDRKAKLQGLVFHQKLGSVWDKVVRVAALARELAPACGADPDLCEQAARLGKMDLVTETVGEFPELQGQIGRQLYEATEKAPTPSIAAAIEDHYRPMGPNDRVPADPVAVAVALADKLDTLVGFWRIDEKPTGSSDPYALRRAALGVIRLLLAHDVRLSLDRVNDAQGLRFAMGAPNHDADLEEILDSIVAGGVYGEKTRSLVETLSSKSPPWLALVKDHDPSVSDSIRGFMHERLKVHLRDQGVKNDQIDAVLAMPENCDLVLVVRRVEALDAFLKTDDGANLLAGYKRAANIIRAEEKKQPGLSKTLATAFVDPSQLADPAEKALFAAIEVAAKAANDAMLQERFADAMKALAGLRAPVDAFFEAVLVNADDKSLRANRLALLALIRASLGAVADFSRIEG